MTIRDAVAAASRYLADHEDEARYRDSMARARVERGLRVSVSGPDGAALATDMPTGIGGENSAPSPGWLLRAAVASCVATLIEIRAAALGFPSDSVVVEVDSESDDRGILGLDPAVPAGPLSMRVVARVGAGGRSTEDVRSIVEWAVEHCPVTDALKRAVPLTVEAPDLDGLARMTGGRVLESAPIERGAVYRRLGVAPIINGRSTFTILGGSLMPPHVLGAMRSAAECFVDLLELQTAVGRRIAELTRNEAAFVSGGAAAGLFLSAAAAMVRDTPDGILRQADLPRLPREFIIHAAHRVPYDASIELAGGRLVEIGTVTSTEESDLVAALDSTTAAVVYVPKAHMAPAVLPLELVVVRAHEHGIPVIVDAAAQVPPRSNLWAFTAAGADLVLFSGGKALCGPASTGLVLGTSRYVDLVARNAAPLHRPGRPMKAGKEDLVGLLAAVEWYLEQDEEAELARFEAMVEDFVTWGVGRSGVTVTREAMGEAGQPTPRALIAFDGWTSDERDALQAALRAGRPRIDLLADKANGLYVAPETLLAGEEVLITDRLGELLDAPG